MTDVELVPDNLPIVREVSLERLQLSPESVEPLLVLSRAALEHTLVLPRGVPQERAQDWARGRYPDRLSGNYTTIYVVPEPYNVVHEATIVDHEPGKGFAFDIETLGMRHESSHIGDKKTLWSPSEAGAQAKLDERTEIIARQDALVDGHPLGKAAFVVINEFGGIDYRQPEQTALHLAFRGLLTNEVGMEAWRVPGVLHPMLRELLGREFYKHMTELSDTFHGISLLSTDERRQRNLPVAIEDAVEKSLAFVEQQRPVLEQFVLYITEPALVKRVIEAWDPIARDLEHGRGRPGGYTGRVE